jgi:nitrile hydratase accessory protein
MTSGTLHAVTAADGPEALPRRNGELVFNAPWESRAFGVAIALHDAGAIDYEVFRSRLIAEIAGRAGERGEEDGGDYYERWLDALQHVLLEQKIVSEAELAERAGRIAHAWAHDHEHDHDHDHDHEP